MEKKLFLLSFFLHGFIALVAQVTILRELMIAFYGNELFMAATLGFWLLGGGLGSWLSHKIPTERVSLPNLLALDLALIALTIPTEIFLIRFLKGRLFLLGEVPNFLTGLGLSFLLLLPFCFILNAFFTFATRFFSQKKKKNIPQLISSAYFWETLGLACGGLLLNFLLIKLPEFKIALFLSGLSLFLSFSLTPSPWLKKTAFFLGLMTTWLAFSPLGSSLNQQTLELIHPDLLETANSQYGRVTVTGSAGQDIFFESGNLVGTDQDLEASEYLAHFVLNFHPRPEKILLIGGGFNGVISELLKYSPIKKIDYVEVDPLFLKTVKKYLPSELQEALENPKITINYQDGRKFLKQTKEKYDLVLFLLPNPANTLLNRFYTQECFQEVKERLNPEGIFAFSLSVPVDYLSQEAKKLTSSLYWTTKRVFSQVAVFPETDSLFLASNQPLTTNPNILTDRFEKTNVKTNFVTSEYFSYRTKSDHIGDFERIFQENKNVKTNLDFFPAAYFYQITFWQTQSSFFLAKIFSSFANFDWRWISLSLWTPFLVLLRKARKSSSIVPVIVATAGLTLMVFETLTIFAFQATLGFLFAKISLLFTAFLISMGAGNLWATRFPKDPLRKLKLILLLIILYHPFFLWILSRSQSEPPFYFLAFVIGFLVGTVFPLANQVFLEKDKKATLKTGVLYSADLIGASFGAILTSVFLVPVLGLYQTVSIVNLLNILLFLFFV